MTLPAGPYVWAWNLCQRPTSLEGGQQCRPHRGFCQQGNECVGRPQPRALTLSLMWRRIPLSSHGILTIKSGPHHSSKPVWPATSPEIRRLIKALSSPLTRGKQGRTPKLAEGGIRTQSSKQYEYIYSAAFGLGGCRRYAEKYE